MNENDDERWITERFRAGDGFREIASAAIARGYERGKAEGAESARGWTDALDAELTRVRNALTRFGVPDIAGEVPHHRAIQPAERVDMLGDDRDRLAKRCEEFGQALDASNRKLGPLMREAAKRSDDPNADRLAALEQRVGAFVDLVIAVYDPGMPDEEYISRLAALRSPVAHLPPEVARLQCVVGVLTNERDAARRERDEALSIARRLVDGSGETLEGIIRDARALVAGQPVAESKPSNALEAVLRGRLDARDAEIERLQERCRDAAHVLVDAVGSATPANVDELAQRAATEIETLRAKLAEAEHALHQYVRRADDAERQRDALRAHAEKLDGLCERALGALVDAASRTYVDGSVTGALRARGEVPR